LSETAIEREGNRERMKAKRELLFERYLKHPYGYSLALEIKIMGRPLAETASKRNGRREAGTKFVEVRSIQS